MSFSDGAANSVAPLAPGFSVPHHDLGDALETLGIKLFTRERSLAQYVSWSVRTGLMRFLDSCGPSTIDQISAGTSLTEIGADSLLGVLCALGFVSRDASGTYRLSQLAREYLLERSPFYIAQQIESRGFPIPRPYIKRKSRLITALKLQMLAWSPAIRYGSADRLLNQHARNLCACARAVRTGEFANVSTMIDIAGGSGTFSIPLALDHPKMRIVLTDLPKSLIVARMLINSHGLQERVTVQALNALQRPWTTPPCDGVFMGNFLHGFDDAVCLEILREAHDRLSTGGHVWIHEMLWRESRDGPLITALWHAAMRGGGPGRQRSASEFKFLLSQAEFVDIRVVETSGAYALIVGRKSR